MRKTLKTLLMVCSAILAAELIFVVWATLFGGNEPYIPLPTGESTEQMQSTTEGTLPQTETTVPSTEVTEEPTTAPTETVAPTTEPGPESFLLTFAGDCTLASDPGNYASPHGFIQTIGEDYGFPFRNVAHIFENDDFTIVNLESVMADEGYGANKLFVFKGPTAYTNIFTSSSVEAVTLANNHTLDYGQAGYDSTIQALEGANVAYVEKDKTKLYVTESGLIIGLYADSFDLTKKDIEKNIADLKSQGAEVIICAFHWGTEGSYRATAAQQDMAKAAIDAGAHIIYGHHPHVLQKMETYNGGLICYSLGNFSFGGNHFPRDLDSAIVQQEIIRDPDGTIRMGETTIIPVKITSLDRQNNFQPTPYAEGTEEYDRTLSKLDGTFTGPDLNVNYDHLKPTNPPTTPPVDGGGSEGGSEGGSQGGNEGGGDVQLPEVGVEGGSEG
jgi:poly-gamma-glutamate synthesis protein (capsule biosynthesis protein)